MKHVIVYMILLLISISGAQQEEANYDESLVPEYTLPDALIFEDGTTVESTQQWVNKRRGEILALFEQHMYGRAPGPKRKIKYSMRESDPNALDGMATRKQVRVYLLGKKKELFVDVLMYLPNSLEKPVPIFLGLNFHGNHTTTDDPAVFVTESWMRNSSSTGVSDHQATADSRGSSSSRWPYKEIIGRGYGVATAYYGDIDPDDEGSFENGIHPYFYEKGQIQPEPDEWGSIAAWAWGLGRIVDYFEKDADIDNEKIMVMGHSRLGKTSLWAGATDQRFALVISNNSGCGGAALSRRAFGETVKRINTVFPHWFCDNFNQYNGQENDLPIDQHMLIALMAPRPVYIASAAEDLWADPRGEFTSGKHAESVYELFGLEGLPVEEMPEINQSVMGTIGYHIREGKHDVTLYDWQRYMDFADKHLK